MKIPVVVVLIVSLGRYSLGVSSCTEPGKFGPDCHHSCHCSGQHVQCDDAGKCPEGCARGWSGPSCQRENIAYKRRSFQKEGRLTHNSSLAIDDDDVTCSSSKAGVPGWWNLDLGNASIVEHVKILSNASVNIRGWRIFVGFEDNIFSMEICTTVRVHGNGVTVSCDLPITGQYVKVVNRDGPVVICDFQIYVCSKYWYGEQCAKTCNCADTKEVCDVITGACASGCAVGWTGSDCRSECSGYYGEECAFRCGHCLNNMSCDHVTGLCSNGCAVGWSGEKCDIACPKRTFGQRCQFPCGHCHGNESCDPGNGVCHHGCEAGWTGELCNQTCEPGQYGDNCASSCGHCREGQPCDRRHGYCARGCRAGWEGFFCTQACGKGRYGPNCSRSCSHCRDLDCDKVSGVCTEGCAPGSTGHDCLQGCEDGTFGVNCSSTCNHCNHGAGQTCDPVTGHCLHGCQPGLNGTMCSQSCSGTGYYGSNCKEKCGACKPGTICDPATGRCPDGCATGFFGDICSESAAFSDVSGPQLKIFLGLTITIVGGMIIAVVVCFVIVWNREELHIENKDKAMTSKCGRTYRSQNGHVAIDASEDDDEEESENV